MAKLRAMQSDAPEEEEEDDEEDMPVVQKDKKCGTCKDEADDAFVHTDSTDAALLEAMIENRLLKARLDAENADTTIEIEDEEESEDDEMDEEEVAAKKRKDAADILNTWIAVADDLTPALVRGDSVVEGIEVEDGKLRFDSVDATDLKEAYIKVMKFDDLLEDSNRYDSLAIDTMFKLARKVKARVDAADESATPKNRSREILDSALSNNKRQDASDIRFASIQGDIEAGRKRIGR